MAKDYERHNEAAKLGWIIYYFMGIHIEGEAIKDTITYIQAIITPRKAPPLVLFPLLLPNYLGNSMRDANPIEEETCVRILEDIMEILDKHRADPQTATAVAIALISISAKKLYNLTVKEINDLDLSIANNTQDTILNFMRELND